MTRRIGLFGGTFDPVHLAHLEIARAAREQLALDRLVFIPAFVSPHKTGSPPVDGVHRLRMLELALAAEPWCQIWTHELDAGKPCASADTVAAWSGRHPEDRLWFLLGADALASFSRWIRPHDLLKRARLAVYDRGTAPRRPVDPEERIDVLSGVLHDVSATDLRERIAAGQPTPDLDPAVREYVDRHCLYRSNHPR